MEIFGRNKNKGKIIKVPELSWKEFNQKVQTISIRAKTWDYKVFPEIRGTRFGTALFQFEGLIVSESCSGFPVTGEIKFGEDCFVPGALAEQWNKQPENIAGYSYLLHEPREPDWTANFSLDLFAKDEAYDYIFKAFQVAFSSRNGGILIEAQLSHNSEISTDFWEQNWRESLLVVSQWRVFSGASTE